MNAVAVSLALVVVMLTVATLHIVFESHDLRPQELSAWT
jgi:hypothetical protein